MLSFVPFFINFYFQLLAANDSNTYEMKRMTSRSSALTLRELKSNRLRAKEYAAPLAEWVSVKTKVTAVNSSGFRFTVSTWFYWWHSMDVVTVREHEDVSRWKLQDVSEWLTKQNLGDFAQRFEGKQTASSSLFVLRFAWRRLCFAFSVANGSAGNGG